MIDKDGRFEYSYVLPVSINCNTSTISVFPNPVQDGRVYVSLTGLKGNATATLLSLTGQVISKNTLANGTNTLDVSKLAAGLYILNVSDAEGTNKKVKLNVQH